MQERTLYDFSVRANDGTMLSLDRYRGDVVLVVNTASRCGFTPQYADMEDLYEKYAERGFVILDFPCNQFGEQSPESDAETAEFCQINFKTKFPLMGKIEVNGPNQSPLYGWLKSRRGFGGFDKSHKLGALLDDILSKSDPDYAKSADIKWNFTKFLIDRNGEVAERFEPTADMKSVEEAVKALL